jgi:hypothetical protein
VTPPGWVVTDPATGPDYGPCIQSGRVVYSTQAAPCEMVEVIFDGVSIDPGRAPSFLYRLNLDGVESIQYVPPLAAARWGFRASANGALLIWTRGRGPHNDDGRRQPPE